MEARRGKGGQRGRSQGGSAGHGASPIRLHRGVRFPPRPGLLQPHPRLAAAAERTQRRQSPLHLDDKEAIRPRLKEPTWCLTDPHRSKWLSPEKPTVYGGWFTKCSRARQTECTFSGSARRDAPWISSAAQASAAFRLPWSPPSAGRCSAVTRVCWCPRRNPHTPPWCFPRRSPPLHQLPNQHSVGSARQTDQALRPSCMTAMNCDAAARSLARSPATARAGSTVTPGCLVAASNRSDRYGSGRKTPATKPPTHDTGFAQRDATSNP